MKCVHCGSTDWNIMTGDLGSGKTKELWRRCKNCNALHVMKHCPKCDQEHMDWDLHGWRSRCVRCDPEPEQSGGEGIVNIVGITFGGFLASVVCGTVFMFALVLGLVIMFIGSCLGVM